MQVTYKQFVWVHHVSKTIKSSTEGRAVVTMTPGWPCNKPDLTIKGTTLYSAAMTPGKHGPPNIHDPLHVYSNRELPLTQLPVVNTIDTLHPFLSLETNRLREKVNKALNSEK